MVLVTTGGLKLSTANATCETISVVATNALIGHASRAAACGLGEREESLI
jgi:hypothetical protein